MTNLMLFFGAIMLCCTSMCADIDRELQHEIDVINIALSMGEWSDIEEAKLLGRSEGLFRAIEIINLHHDQ